jgi:phosphatidylserine decarboxylase
MNHVFYLDRKTKKVEEEKIYGHLFLELLYGNHLLSFLISKILLPILTQFPFLSRLYGYLQKKTKSKKKILPFIESYHVIMDDFVEPEGGFTSFNDFFIRKLKKEARPIHAGENVAILPADGRYLVFPNLSKSTTFFVKGQKLSLEALLQDPVLIKRYEEGSLVFARLCPTDYHRFHFPCEGTPSSPRLMNGCLQSVNPIALRKNIKILSENKRVITEIDTTHFGKVLYIEVGATAVGTIQQTYEPHKFYAKGEEKGFFEFGGSTILILFEKNTIVFDEDFIEASREGLEIKAHMGESLGQAFPSKL